MNRFATITDALQGEQVEIKGWHLDAKVDAYVVERAESFAVHSLSGGLMNQPAASTYEIDSIEIGPISVVNESGDMIDVDKTIPAHVRKAFVTEVERMVLEQAEACLFFSEE